MSRRAIVLKIVLPILILTVGAIGAGTMIKGRSAPERKATPFKGVLVETQAVTRRDYPVQVAATGSVQAKQETEIVPQVNGRIVEVAPNLVAGGFFRAGEQLFALEEVDFELAVQRAGANLTKAELDLETMRAQARIARSEWDRLHPGEEPPPLVIYQPQLKNAEASLTAARAALRQAELDLQRTRVTAPFNCYIRSENIDLGQYLRAGDKVVTVVGTDEVEVIVPLPLNDLGWLQVPRKQGQTGSTAQVKLRPGGKTWQWPGVVTRSLGEVDPHGRMERIAVAVADPYALLPQNRGRLQLAVGSFVDVVLQGETLPQVVELPRLALRENDTVWIMDAQNRLQIVPVEVVRRERETVLVSGGLVGGEQVVVTPVTGAANGMLLRTATE